MIDTEERLLPLLAQLENAPWIALDTEANSLYAHPPQLCLIQLSIPDTDVIIDPLASIPLDRLFAAFKDRELILHGADYDLRLLWKHFGFRPKAVFDTMWAARILGLTEFGLGNLVARFAGVTLEKGPQKMNWGKRPLTERMERYAKNDTRYLHTLTCALAKSLEDQGRLPWVKEICERLIAECTQNSVPDTDTDWRIKGSHRLNRKSLGMLRELWNWREREAVKRNKPPYFVLSSEILIEISSRAATGLPVASLLPKHFSHSKEALGIAIARGQSLGPSELPIILKPQALRLTEPQKKRYEALKLRRDKHAETLQLDPALIASKTTLLSLAQQKDEEKTLLMQWQRELLTPETL